MRSLADQFQEILRSYDIEPNFAQEAKTEIGNNITKDLLSAVRKRDKYVIGSNTKVPKHGYDIGNLTDMIRTINESNNETRTEQRKRAKETL